MRQVSETPRLVYFWRKIKYFKTSNSFL